MHRQVVTKSQYLAELNARLLGHPEYVAGMAFVFRTDADPETASGFDWVPDEAPPKLFGDIAAEVHALFRVESP
jgi:hypothetical protein